MLKKVLGYSRVMCFASPFQKCKPCQRTYDEMNICWECLLKDREIPELTESVNGVIAKIGELNK